MSLAIGGRKWKCVQKSELDLCAEDDEEFGEPCRMRGPGGGGDEVAVGDGLGHGETDVGAAGERNVRGGGRIGAALFPLEDTGGGEDLRGVADGGDGFVGFREMVNDFDDA
jgi:hypothetical protein